MVDFRWMPFMFWISAGLTLIPAGLALTLTKPKDLALTIMVVHFGVFLLLTSIGAVIPAIIFLIAALLINTLILYGIIIFPSRHDEVINLSTRSILLRAILCALVFIVLIFAFHQAGTKSLSANTPTNIDFQMQSPDISIFLILSGLLFLLIFIAVSHFIKRR